MATQRQLNTTWDNVKFEGTHPYRCAWKCRKCGRMNNEPGIYRFSITYSRTTGRKGLDDGFRAMRPAYLQWKQRLSDRISQAGSSFEKLDADDIPASELFPVVRGVCDGCGDAQPWGQQALAAISPYAVMTGKELWEHSPARWPWRITGILFFLLMLHGCVPTFGE